MVTLLPATPLTTTSRALATDEGDADGQQAGEGSRQPAARRGRGRPGSASCD
jgi:hypothetical protein